MPNPENSKVRIKNVHQILYRKFFCQISIRKVPPPLKIIINFRKSCNKTYGQVENGPKSAAAFNERN